MSYLQEVYIDLPFVIACLRKICYLQIDNINKIINRTLYLRLFEFSSPLGILLIYRSLKIVITWWKKMLLCHVTGGEELTGYFP